MLKSFFQVVGTWPTLPTGGEETGSHYISADEFGDCNASQRLLEMLVKLRLLCEE